MRKWTFPALSTPLLVIRDPLALWIFMTARQKGYLKFNAYSFLMVLSGLISAFTALTIGHGNLMVAIFGARIWVIQFPLIFAIGRIFDWDDVVRIGRAMLWISLPMTVLIALQFYSPQSAWVNRGVGGDTSGAGFSGALDYFRPPGTFSFTTGVVSFYGLLVAYIFYFWLHSHLVKRWLLFAATACLLAAIPLTISRSAFFEVILSMIFAIIAAWRRPKYIGRIIGASVAVFVIYLVIRNQSFFATSTEAFNARFEGATESEGGINGVILDRFLGGMISAIQNAPNLPFFGYGIGMGTNVGSNLLTGQSSFLISEQEWGRIIGEQGLLLGFVVILVRLSLTIKIIRQAIRHLKTTDALSWMIVSYSTIPLLQSQWGQPTGLGFAILSSGLAIAALNETEAYEDEEEETEEEAEEVDSKHIVVNG
ncbi:MAG TPA: hypothetical protein VG847_11830 [Chitinophagaceae bacterium]|nr:hypothetical protein [Chitinophagaceae bacterium]